MWVHYTLVDLNIYDLSMVFSLITMVWNIELYSPPWTPEKKYSLKLLKEDINTAPKRISLKYILDLGHAQLT